MSLTHEKREIQDHADTFYRQKNHDGSFYFVLHIQREHSGRDLMIGPYSVSPYESWALALHRRRFTRSVWVAIKQPSFSHYLQDLRLMQLIGLTPVVWLVRWVWTYRSPLAINGIKIGEDWPWLQQWNSCNSTTFMSCDQFHVWLLTSVSQNTYFRVIFGTSLYFDWNCSCKS